MNRFLLLWSLISPSCLALIGCVFWLTGLSWHPMSNIWLSIIIYLVYWVPLGILQGLLLFKFKYKKIAYKWFLTTSSTGFLIMLCHDLSSLVLGIDTRGQGVIFLLMSLPFLAILGGFILGFTQFLLLQDYHKVTPRVTYLRPKWFGVSFISWIVSFFSILFFNYMPFALIPLATIGTAIKGYFVMKYLQINLKN